MPEWVWRKIVDNLADMEYTGKISPHFYGEPLMDKRLPSLIDYASENLDGAIVIATNGDYLTDNLLQELIRAGLSYLLVTNYDEKLKSEILYFRQKYPGYIKYRSYKDIRNLMNRAGQIFNCKTIYSGSCPRPESQLVINWQGKVLLCCNDFYAKHMFGNVNTQSIEEIWNNKEFKKVRNILNRGQREKVDICKYCNGK